MKLVPLPDVCFFMGLSNRLDFVDCSDFMSIGANLRVFSELAFLCTIF
jgi:hypothetical protein